MTYSPKETRDRAIAENAAFCLINEALAEIYQADTEQEAAAALHFAFAKAFQQPHRGPAAAGLVRELLPLLAQAMSHDCVGSAPGEYLTKVSEEFWQVPVSNEFTAECSRCGAGLRAETTPTVIEIGDVSATVLLCPDCRKNAMTDRDIAVSVMRAAIDRSEAMTDSDEVLF